MLKYKFVTKVLGDGSLFIISLMDDEQQGLFINIDDSSIDVYRFDDHQRAYLSQFNNYDEFALYIEAEVENFCVDKAPEVKTVLNDNRELFIEKMFYPRYKSKIKHFKLYGLLHNVRDDDFGKYDDQYSITLTETGIWFEWPDYYYNYEGEKWETTEIKSYFYKYEWLDVNDVDVTKTLFDVILEYQDIPCYEGQDNVKYNSTEIATKICDSLELVSWK